MRLIDTISYICTKPISLISMAYEKEIKAGLKNKFHANLGLNDPTYEKVANILGATPNLTEDQIETVVNGAEGWLKVVQGEADIVRKIKGTPQPQPTPTPGGDPNPKPEPTELEAAIAAAVAKAVTPLTDKITTLEKGNLQKATRETLISKLTEKKIDPSFYETAIDGREFANDEDINSFVERLSGAYDKFNQGLADKGLSQIPKPILGDPNPQGISAGVQAYIDSKTNEAKSALGGKAL